jgi:hypothetical protein
VPGLQTSITELGCFVASNGKKRETKRMITGTFCSRRLQRRCSSTLLYFALPTPAPLSLLRTHGRLRVGPLISGDRSSSGQTITLLRPFAILPLGISEIPCLLLVPLWGGKQAGDPGARGPPVSWRPCVYAGLSRLQVTHQGRHSAGLARAGSPFCCVCEPGASPVPFCCKSISGRGPAHSRVSGCTVRVVSILF